MFAIGLLALGIGFIVSGRQLAPNETADAKVFRTDPSCTAPLTSAVAAKGDCTVVTAAFVVPGVRRGGGMSRTPSETPYVYVRFADGTSQTDDLEGSDGRWFASSVRPGSPARVQLFRGKLVRVASGNSVAETISAPDVSATTVSQMPWVGGVLIAIAALFALGGVRSMRRPADRSAP